MEALPNVPYIQMSSIFFELKAVFSSAESGGADFA
jgi:hypothetical protein